MVRAKAPLLVLIVVAGGGAPEFPIGASLRGAAAVRLAQELEGEGAGLALGVPSNHGRVWGGGKGQPWPTAAATAEQNPLKLNVRRSGLVWGLCSCSPPLAMPGLRPSLSTCIPHAAPRPERHMPPSPPTSIWAEAVFLVLVKVGGGRAPAVAVCAPIGGATLVGFALEDEGENALLPVAVPVVGEED